MEHCPQTRCRSDFSPITEHTPSYSKDMKKLIISTLFASGLLLAAQSPMAQPQSDVIAQVGDQQIRFHDIEVMINSSNMVGLKIPPTGSQARNRLRLTLLDKVIDANLIYLDAKQHQADNNQVYQYDVQRYRDAMLASIFKRKYLTAVDNISDAEVLAYYKQHVDQSKPFTKDTGDALRAVIKKQKFIHKKSAIRQTLRKGVSVKVFEKELTLQGDASRRDEQVIARLNDEPVLWRDVKNSISSQDEQQRIDSIHRYMDKKIILLKARQIGLERDPDFLATMDEYKKTRLINLHRSQLLAQMEPTDQQLGQYFVSNRAKISIDEARKLQMIVVADESRAGWLKNQIENGKMTLFEAASQYSIDPKAKSNLGEIGWVLKGSGFPALNDLAFSLALNQLGGPVKSPAGWHLVKVLDIRDARFQDIAQAETRKKTRRLFLNDKMDEYVIQLRKTRYSVEVYEQVFKSLVESELS